MMVFPAIQGPRHSGIIEGDVWTVTQLNYMEMEIINSKPDASIQQLLVEENYYLFIASYYSSNILFKYPWLLLKTEPSPSYSLLMSGVWASPDYGHDIKMIKSEEWVQLDAGVTCPISLISSYYDRGWGYVRCHLVNGPFVTLSLVNGAFINRD